MKYRYSIFLLFLILNLAVFSQPQKFDKYHTPKEAAVFLKKLAKNDLRVVELSKTSGGNEILCLKAGSENAPVIMVAANMEGDNPLATEAALKLADDLSRNPKLYSDNSWLIIPCGNPDAADRFFQKPLYQSNRNFDKVNDDLDENIDEDGFEDLNSDGYITSMRVKDPMGEWIVSEKDIRIMRKALPEKGEKGIYKLYSEGIDNDNDGKYNEDMPGGINLGCNYPQFFRPFTKTDGKWPGVTPESKSIIKFVNETKNIAMIIVFGSTNISLNKPAGGRKGESDLNKIFIPRRFVSFLNAEPGKAYSMQEVIDLAKGVMPPGTEVDEADVIEMLGLSSFNNPLPEDIKFYEEISLNYQDFIKRTGMDSKRLDAEKEKDGSFEVYSYYQLGVPAFSMDFWTLPITSSSTDSSLSLEVIGKMSNEEFLKLDKEKIEKFLKANNAPDNFSYEQLTASIKSGKLDIKKMIDFIKKNPTKKESSADDIKMEALLAWNDKSAKKCFIDWKAFNHPQLGEVEIGGVIPYSYCTPPESMVDNLVSKQVPWVFELAGKLPKIKILKVESVNKGSGIYEIKAFVENSGYLPYPTAAGVRTNKIKPVILSFDNPDLKFLDGKKRMLIKKINGNSSQLVRWLVHSEKPGKLKLIMETGIGQSGIYEFQLGGK